MTSNREPLEVFQLGLRAKSKGEENQVEDFQNSGGVSLV